MSLFIDEFKTELGYRVSLVFWAAVTLFVVIAGPFGSYQTMSLTMRLVIGVPLMALLMLVGITLRALVFHFVGHLGFRVASGMTALIAALVMAPTARLLLNLTPIGDRMASPGLLELGILVTSLSLGHSSVRRVLDPEDEPLAAEAEAQIDPAERLLHRLDPPKRGPILAISVRDHYVDVQTGKGQASLLLRFSDAMAEVDPAAGVQVHRSHWVAWEAIEAVEREGVKIYLKLKHGARVPVSKNHRGKLEDRGLI
jgi:hypothetical protein